MNLRNVSPRPLVSHSKPPRNSYPAANDPEIVRAFEEMPANARLIFVEMIHLLQATARLRTRGGMEGCDVNPICAALDESARELFREFASKVSAKIATDYGAR